MMAFDITTDAHNPLPLHEQIKDRVKLGLLLGGLRPGDHLPSIRQLDDRLHIGTAVIRRAYRELAEAGILDLQHGRGVFVKNGIHRQATETTREYDALYDAVSRQLDRANLVPACFARFLYARIGETERRGPSVAFVEDSKSIARDYVAQLSQEWQIPISAFTITELRNLHAVQRAELRRVLTDYYHVDEVREIMRKNRAQVIPVNVEFSPEMMDDIGALPSASRVVFVIHKEDFVHLRNYVRSFFEDKFAGSGIQFNFVSSDQVQIPELLESNYAQVFVSNRIWDELDAEMRNKAILSRPRLQVTPQSVKSAWTAIGVI
jgi:DNA-binding transcriptional regulator YhcF (GntR family)